MGTLVVKALGGLCNKLRVTFSYYKKAISENKKLIIIWIEGWDCPGFFLDYFEPIENITFLKNLQDLKIDISTCEQHKDFKGTDIYSKLKLLPDLENKVKNNIKLLDNNYVAVHIRRTDNKESIKKSPNQIFINFIEKNPTSNVYIATDNRETQNIFVNKYKDKIKIINLINSKTNPIRATNLEMAIIDLYTCIHASNFQGSYWSAFSDFITLQRNYNNFILNK